MPYRDLREYLKALENKGLLCHVTAEVDKDWEISAVCRQVAASGKLLHLDVAELNPEFDVDGRTARVAARLINTLLE